MLNRFPGKKKGKRSGCTELMQILINEHQIEKVWFFSTICRKFSFDENFVKTQLDNSKKAITDKISTNCVSIK